jgi:hypothetical protein
MKLSLIHRPIGFICVCNAYQNVLADELLRGNLIELVSHIPSPA